MSANSKVVVLVAALSVLVASAFGATAQQRVRGHHRPYVRAQVYYPVPSGYYAGYYGAPYSYGYDNGWRKRSNARGWDNTCLDLPWLPSEFACSAK